ncbi:MAG TPA: 2,3,4,5-tetrahydropyridine-2,6-dicarboxylate N-succinyltransferase [Gemmatimonadaceae bacterium]|nr:2,3,4,5-tetrahydropyridine-2,6-dicarboxylate N-succinyltransferase [Gemmatimonadaceae bacterium]
MSYAMPFLDLAAIRQRIGTFMDTPAADMPVDDVERTITALLGALERGEVRAAERDDAGKWRAVTWVKQGILLGFRVGHIADMSLGGKSSFRFFDKHLYPAQAIQQSQGVRIVPGGSTVRRGAFLSKGVVCMPPMYVNVGAWVGPNTMIDSHALVGSCAQVGARVHLSAAAQIGGVLEPVHAAPVIIEDDVFVGGNSGVYEGTVVREGAVLAAGVILTRGVPVFDAVRERTYRSNGDAPLEIPAGAVVVPGARPLAGEWARGQGLAVHAPVIVKYRDAGTNASTTLEQWLR